MDRLRPDLPWYAKALYWPLWLGFMALFIIFVLPLIDTYVGIPFADWISVLIFGSAPAGS